MVRPPRFDKNGLKKGAWSPEEDDKLIQHIKRNGHENWRQLPKLAGLQRCGKSCRLRWMNYLRPDLKRGNFTKEEEDMVMQLHAQLGKKWSAMAAKLPGRTDNEIKNYWHTHLKKRLHRNESPERKPQFTDREGTEIREGINQKSEATVNSPAHPISDGSMEPSESEISSSSCENGRSGMNWVAVQSYADESFWSEPFVADTFYFQSGFPTSFEDVLLSPNYAAYYEDGMDSYLLQELPPY
ncbi:hypothetical protein NMG60_11003052 [Bertholletia excelsa]